MSDGRITTRTLAARWNAGRGGHQRGPGAWRGLIAGGVGLLLLAAACGGSEGDTSGGGASAGTSSGGSGNTGSGGGDLGFTTGSGAGGNSTGTGGTDNCGTVLQAVIRDFQESHADFGDDGSEDYGIVAPELGADGKPVYAGNPTTPTTHGQENFDQWFRDVPGVNQSIPLQIELTDAGGGVYTYENSEFFPIDGEGFGNEGQPHNYSFTLELRTKFEYKGGEVFTFRGDDDVFAYINGKLVIDLGGIHSALESVVDLDDRAAELGITPGNTYSLDFFFAERHATQSNFRIDTSIGCFTPVPPE